MGLVILISLLVSTTIPIGSYHSLPFPHSQIQKNFALGGEEKLKFTTIGQGIVDVDVVVTVTVGCYQMI
jgi:hypothetical protein